MTLILQVPREGRDELAVRHADRQTDTHTYALNQDFLINDGATRFLDLRLVV